MTQYNNRTYKIDGLRFDLSPGSFFDFQGSKITFGEYMLKRYKLAVKVSEQPLLVSGEIYLIPEFCLAVGMTERLNEQKGIYREVAMAKNGDAPIKIKGSIQLVKQIMSDPNCIERMKDWRFFVESECASVQGTKHDAGDILMGHQTLQTAERSINSRAD